MSTHGPQANVVVVILTLNEEGDIRDAIESARDAFQEVVVLDSYSDDQTVALARAAGARVVQHEFKGYAAQRNYALNSIRYEAPWLLFLDADERITPELANEIRDVISEGTEGIDLFYLRRRDHFFGRWIKRSSGYPTWFGRLCRIGAVTVVREINEEYRCHAGTARLVHHLDHYPFSKGIQRWVERHNAYSSMEASVFSDRKISERNADLFSRDPGIRRRRSKQIYMALPARPLIGFIYLYVLRGGFLDGLPGMRFAILRAIYEYLIDLKALETRYGANVAPVETAEEPNRTSE